MEPNTLGFQWGALGKKPFLEREKIFQSGPKIEPFKTKSFKGPKRGLTLRKTWPFVTKAWEPTPRELKGNPPVESQNWPWPFLVNTRIRANPIQNLPKFLCWCPAVFPIPSRGFFPGLTRPSLNLVWKTQALTSQPQLKVFCPQVPSSLGEVFSLVQKFPTLGLVLPS